jgi:hypothetical protein
MTDATPKPQFLSATMEGVLVALDDYRSSESHSMRDGRLVTAYTTNFRDHVDRLGYIPARHS